LSEAFKDKMKGRRLLSAAFMTYQYDPGFFEQQILPVFLDTSVSHATKIRQVQLEDCLRCLAGAIDVYYDAGGLVPDDAGSAVLAIGRYPIRKERGVFHPKNVFALVEDLEVDEDGYRAKSLILSAMSANLTQTGWWNNVECAHLVEIEEGEDNRLKEDLVRYLKAVREATAPNCAHEALGRILKFLSGTGQRRKRFLDGGFLPHFYAGGFGRRAAEDRGVAGFLETVAGKELQGMYLEIISPFFDNAEVSHPLDDIMDRFQPKEVRIFLPRDDKGEVLVRPELYEWVRAHGKIHWGKLVGDHMRTGKSQEAKARYVHAKVYRFFSQNPKREICFLGSPNLTNAAHSGLNNVESGLLAEWVPERRPEFWMQPEDQVFKENDFKQGIEDETAGAVPGSDLNIRYDWGTKIAEVSWEGRNPSPVLELASRGIILGQVESLDGAGWHPLDAGFSQEVQDALRSTSLMEVRGEHDDPGLILVQETGMSDKPSLLLSLTAADILKYWSLLTPAQRNAYLEKAFACGVVGPGTEYLAKAAKLDSSESLFNRLAGVFHAFGCLDRAVRKAIQEGNPKEAEYRLFGRKYDSLGTLLDRLERDGEGGDAVERYLILLCARQTAMETAKEFPEFWEGHAPKAKELNQRFSSLASLRDELIKSNPEEMKPFLEWFDHFFLKRATPMPKVTT
jgi:hypothetical protein